MTLTRNAGVSAMLRTMSVRTGTVAWVIALLTACSGGAKQRAKTATPAPARAAPPPPSGAGLASAAASTATPAKPESAVWPWPRLPAPASCLAPPPGAPGLELLPQFGSYSLASSLVVSPDGRFAVFVDESRNVRLWDTRSGQLRAIYRGHRHRLQAVAFHPTLPVLVSVTRDEPARLWDLLTGAARDIVLDPGGSVQQALFSPDGRTLALAYADHVALHEADGSRLATLANASGSSQLQFSQDGSLLLTYGVAMSTPDQFIVWKVAGGQELTRVPVTAHATHHAALSPDGRLVVWSPFEGAGGISDAKSGVQRSTLPTPGHVESVQISADSRTALIGGHGISLFDMSSGRMVSNYPDLYGYHAHLLLDGSVLATGLDRHSLSIARGAQRVPFQLASQDEVLAVAPTPDGSTVVGSIFLIFPDVVTWDARTGARRSRNLHQRATTKALAWSPDAARVALLLGEGTAPGERASVMDLTSGSLQQLEVPGRGDALETLAWSPDGALLAVGTMRDVYVCDARTGKQLSRLGSDEHFSAVHEVLFLPDGRLLASVSMSFARTELRIHEPRSGKKLATVESPVGHVHALALSADRQRIAVAGARGTAILDTPTLHTRLSFQGTGNVMDVAWTPDGKRLVVASNPDTLAVWDALTGAQVTQLIKPASRVVRDGHNKHARSVGVSPDGKLLVSGGGNEVELWDLQKLEHLTSIAGDEEDVDSVRWAPSGDIVAIGRRAVQLVRTRDGESVFARPVTPENGVPAALFYTRSGLYFGSPAVLGLLRFRSGKDRLASPLLEPGAVPQNSHPHLIAELQGGCWLSLP